MKAEEFALIKRRYKNRHTRRSDVRSLIREVSRLRKALRVQLSDPGIRRVKQRNHAHDTEIAAADLVNEMLPLLQGTDKGDQAVRELTLCGYKKQSDGTYALPVGRLAKSLQGNQHAKGKTWKLTEETRRNMSAAAQRRYARR